MKQRLLQLSHPLIITAMLGTGYYAGNYGRYQRGYEQALDDVASGQVSVSSNATRTALERGLDHARQVEYERVVLQVAEAYQKDPSEVEIECGLTNERGEIRR